MVTPLDGFVQTGHGDPSLDDWELVDLDLVEFALGLDMIQVPVVVRELRTIVFPVGNFARFETLDDRLHPVVSCLDTRHAPEQRLAPGTRQV